MSKESQITAKCAKGHELQLYDHQIDEGLQILRCPSCGLFYHYVYGWGGWKLKRTSAVAYQSKKALKI